MMFAIVSDGCFTDVHARPSALQRLIAGSLPHWRSQTTSHRRNSRSGRAYRFAI